MRCFLLIFAVVAVAGFSVEAAESHWAFKSIAKAKPPKVKAKAWALGDVDRFVLNRLEAKGLTPVRDADRHTLLRRATFYLTGLPPTPKEIDAFLQDSSPDAFAKVVDRLLASPRYGERWGRHWLDVVRYADTAGENSDMPVDDAWRYRNYVVHAFNKDTPFDRFIREQLAGDIMSKSGAKISPERYSELITATGYLAISRRHGHDAKKDHYLTIEDTIDTLGKSFLGLTIACARCHDHKFDPISAKDYYGLYGIFASTRYAYPGSEGNRPITDLVPLQPHGDLVKHVEGWKTRQAELTTKVTALKKNGAAQSAAFTKLASQPRTELAKGIVPIKTEQNFAVTVEVKAGEVLQLTIGPRANYGADTTILEWQITSADGKLKWDLTGDTLDNLLAGNPHADRHGNAFVWSFLDARKLGVLLTAPVTAVDNHKPLQAWKAAGAGLPQAMVNAGNTPVQAWTSLPPRTFYVHPAADGPVAVAWTSPVTGKVSLKGKVKDGHPFGDGVDWKLEQLRGDFRKAIHQPGQLTQQLAAAEAVLQAHAAKEMKMPTAYAVSEEMPDKLKNVALHKRGDPKQPGVIVPRKNLELLGGQSVREGSGRLQLAEWIAAADNPLTARVIANRVWLNHFGRGLVSTPNDFGTQGQPPTHPALLDWLATELIRNKWSLKALHRLIMLSATYQTAADESPAQKLYGAFTPRRLSAEELRDTLLTLSGTLALAMPEGHPFPAKRNGLSQHNPFRANYEHQHRSVYLMVQRIQRRPLMAIFDGADPNASTGQRRLSNVPTQALYFLNNEFLHTHATGLAKQLAATQDAGVR
ncbi:MAG: DUF1549 and DUF1553 domain-containing protein, partial [Verrucomicrobiota bacterium]|nr:DUF1549 and DUF1553 domain-containing protein [Verrucomicrobiota bacterium]